jgi:hypothetical protein
MPGIDGVIRDLACNNNAGIVEDVVNAAELLHRLGHKSTDSSKVAHIEMPGGSAAALLTDLRGSRFRVAEFDVREDDLAATLRKSLGDCSPDPGPGAGHYCDPTVECAETVCHLSPPCRLTLGVSCRGHTKGTPPDRPKACVAPVSCTLWLNEAAARRWNFGGLARPVRRLGLISAFM